MSTKNLALWANSPVGPQGPQGPTGPAGANGVLYDSWWLPLLWPAAGVNMYARTVFDGAAIQICGAYLPGYEVGTNTVGWLGYLPTGCEVIGAHFVPCCLAIGSQGWTMAGLRINFDYPNLVALETYGYAPASQFFCDVATIAKDGLSIG